MKGEGMETPNSLVVRLAMMPPWCVLRIPYCVFRIRTVWRISDTLPGVAISKTEQRVLSD